MIFNTNEELETFLGRLERLATFLRELPPLRFFYGNYVGPDPDDRAIPKWKGDPDLSCGTSACAFGWAATMPEFKALGMRIENIAPPSQDPRALIRFEKYGTVIDAHEKVFGLDDVEYELLFEPKYNGLGRYASAELVADHIMKFVKEKREEYL